MVIFFGLTLKEKKYLAQVQYSGDDRTEIKNIPLKYFFLNLYYKENNFIVKCGKRFYFYFYIFGVLYFIIYIFYR